MTATLGAGRHADERPLERVRRALVELRDRARVSDPGLGRLRSASSAVICVGTALPVQLGVGALLGYPGQVGFAVTMFGAVVAMLGSNALAGADGWTKVRTAAFFPLAVAAGLLPATLTDGRQLFQVAGFAVMLFLAVWVRRFGPDFFSYGFMAWMGFFFATFLHATLALVPALLVASVVSTAWVLLLTTTVLRNRPRDVLHSTLTAFFTAGRSVARECADLLQESERQRGAPAPGPARGGRASGGDGRGVAARRGLVVGARRRAGGLVAERPETPADRDPAVRRALLRGHDVAGHRRHQQGRPRGGHPGARPPRPSPRHGGRGGRQAAGAGRRRGPRPAR